MLRLSLVSIAAASLVLVAGACNEAPDTIVLGKLPKRPVDRNAEDAGFDIPDGSIPCESEADCDDGVDCTVDVCLSQGYCRSTTDFTRCADDSYCNGIEVCDAVKGCIPGVVPTCDDMDPCTIDSCSDAEKSCVHGPRDFDHDGEADAHCAGGTDCDDFDETRGTSRAEICGDQIDNDCDEMIDEQNCGKPAHDSCDDALDITTPGTHEVSLLGAVGDYTLSCTPDPGGAADAVFTFELTETRDVRITARGILLGGEDENATVAVQTKCGVRSSEVKCAYSFPADLRLRALQPGRYYVVANSPQAASVWISFDTSAPTPAPTNGLCENAIDVSAGGRFEGDFIDVGDETMSVCGNKDQPDVYYKLTLDKESDVEISAVSDEAGLLTISVRDTCDPTSTVRGCRSAAPALTRLHQLPPGEYIIVLEGPAARELSYALEVSVLDPTPVPQGDGCNMPIPLSVGTPTLVSLADKQAEVKSSCESSGPDAVFSMHLDVARRVVLQVDAENETVYAAVQKTCGDVGTERACRKQAPLEVQVQSLDPGDYFVVVDSPTAQNVTVQLQTYDPTPTVNVTGNDNCFSAYEIFGTGGTYTGDTRTLLNDFSDACGTNVASLDAVYKLQLNDRRHVTAQIESGFDGVLHRIRAASPDMCATTPSDACAPQALGGNIAALDEFLPSGVYYYVIDGFNSINTGFYTFSITISAP